MSDNIIKLVLENEEFKFWSSFSITQSIDTLDTFNFDAPFGENSGIKDAIKPLQFKPGQLFIDDELLSTIVLVNPIPTIEVSNSISVKGYSKPGVMNDSSIKYLDYPIEFNGQTLEQIAKKLAGFFAIETEFQGGAFSPGSLSSSISGAVFEKVKLEAGAAPLDFLIKLAKDRGFLISNTADGKLLFWRAAKDADSTTLKEGHTPLSNVTASINPQEYYSEITGLSPGKTGSEFEEVTISNPHLNTTRPLVYKLKQRLSGADLQNAVKWKMGRMFASAIKYSIDVQGLRDERGKIWKKNTFINLTAPGAYVNNETKFLIDNLTLAKSESETTTMNLVLPEARAGEIPDRLPWE